MNFIHDKLSLSSRGENVLKRGQCVGCVIRVLIKNLILFVNSVKVKRAFDELFVLVSLTIISSVTRPTNGDSH